MKKLLILFCCFFFNKLQIASHAQESLLASFFKTIETYDIPGMEKHVVDHPELVTMRNEGGLLPIEMAIATHNYSGFDLLRKKKADLTVINPDTGNSLLHLAAHYCNDYAIEVLVTEENLFLQNNADKIALHEFFGQNKMLIADVLEHVPEDIRIKSLCPSLEDKGMKIISALLPSDKLKEVSWTARDNEGRTALHYAVLLGDCTLAQELIKKYGCDDPLGQLEQADELFCTPLDYAVLNNNIDMIKALFDGVILNKEEQLKHTIYFYNKYIFSDEIESQKTFLLDLLLDKKVNNSCFRFYILKHPLSLQILLEKKLIDLKSNDGIVNNLLRMSFYNGSSIALDILLKHQANPNARVYESTVLHNVLSDITVEKFDAKLECIKLLMKYGADKKALNSQNKTPIDMFNSTLDYRKKSPWNKKVPLSDDQINQVKDALGENDYSCCSKCCMQ